MRLGRWPLCTTALRALGVGRPTGVDLPGENPGIFRPLPKWSGLSTASISMGQEVSLNALQLARITAVAANGGYLVEPHLVTRIVEPGGRVARRARRRARPCPLAADGAGDLEDPRGRRRAGHRREGGGPGFRGRRQDRHGAEGRGRADTRPAATSPTSPASLRAENPRCVAVVVLEEPQGKYYAADVAAPLFSRVMAQALGILRVAPREQRVPEAILADAAPLAHGVPRYRAGIEPASTRPHGPGCRPQPERTPSVLGFSAREAVAVFASAGVARPAAGKRIRRRARPAARARRCGRAPCRLSFSPTAQTRRPGPPERRAEETPPPPSTP